MCNARNAMFLLYKQMVAQTVKEWQHTVLPKHSMVSLRQTKGIVHHLCFCQSCCQRAKGAGLCRLVVSTNVYYLISSKKEEAQDIALSCNSLFKMLAKQKGVFCASQSCIKSRKDKETVIILFCESKLSSIKKHTVAQSKKTQAELYCTATSLTCLNMFNCTITFCTMLCMMYVYSCSSKCQHFALPLACLHTATQHTWSCQFTIICAVGCCAAIYIYLILIIVVILLVIALLRVTWSLADSCFNACIKRSSLVLTAVPGALVDSSLTISTEFEVTTSGVLPQPGSVLSVCQSNVDSFALFKTSWMKIQSKIFRLRLPIYVQHAA